MPLLALALLTTAGFALRLDLTEANLPVAANVDERTALALLHRISAGDWNPEWFQYPTLYFYVTALLTSVFPADRLLEYGRVVNLIFGCGLGIAAYWLAMQVYARTTVAALAAALTLSSPILVQNASYLSTDVLATLLAVVALGFLVRYRADRRSRDWLAGALVAGFATSAKYTAALVVLAYVILEFLDPQALDLADGARPPSHERHISRRAVVASSLLVGVLMLSLAAVFPLHRLLRIVASAGGIDSQVDQSDVLLLQYARGMLATAGGVVCVLALLAWRLPSVATRLARRLPYATLAIAALAFVAGSPFVLVSTERFLYGVGVELKANALGAGSAQWFAYVDEYLRWESWLVLMFFSIGAVISVRHERAARLILLYLALGYAVIGSAHRGFDRYLTPLLPIVFIISARGMWHVAGHSKRLGLRARPLRAAACAALAIVQIAPRLVEVRDAASRPTSSREMFVLVNMLRPNRILYSGDAVPSVEWKAAGLEVTQLPRASLHESIELLSDRPSAERDAIVALDGVADGLQTQSVRARLKPVWRDSSATSPPEQLYAYEVQ